MATIPTEDYGYQTPTVPLGASSSTLFTSVEGSSITTISAGTINADQFRYQTPTTVLGFAAATLFSSVEGSSITTISAGTINADQFRYKIPQAALGNQLSTFILTSNEPIDQQAASPGQVWYFS